MTSTHEGRIISTKSVLLNAPDSIRENLDPDSNVVDELVLQSENTTHRRLEARQE
jgi:hypothetical protein